MNGRKRFIRVLFVALISICTIPAFAETEVHIIEELNFIITGSTRERSIRQFVDVQEGATFYSEDDLIDLISEEKQDLINYRVYDSVEMEYEKIRTDGAIHYWRVTYTVEDAFTFIPIPYPKYSTNNGFRLAVQLNYANAFGTLTDLSLNVGFNIQEGADGNLGISQWNFTPEWRRIRISDNVNMVVTLDMSKRNAEFLSGDPATQYHYTYYRTGLGTTFSFRLPGYWGYSISPYFDFRYAYEDQRNWGNYDEEPLNLAFRHSIGWGRVNWRMNFRHGHNYALSHNLRYVLSSNVAERKLVNELDLIARWYYVIADMLNFYTRLGTFYVFNSERSGGGRYIRGVANNSLSGNTGVYLQNSLGFQFWRLEGVWDAQVHPFFDIGIVGNAGEIGGDNLAYGTGVDLVLYLDKLPTLVARATIGFDLSDPSRVSLGQKLEIEITSSLSY